MNTTQDRIADVVCTFVFVVAVEATTDGTDTGRTDIARGTNVVIATRCVVCSVLAAQVGVAGVTGTGVGIVAIESCRRGTQPVTTNIPCCALILVVTARGVVGVNTTDLWVTGVVCTGVGVITIQYARGRADLVLANITRGTHIGVGAVDGVCGVAAARLYIAGIICADVVVITVQGCGAGLTGARGTNVSTGAGVSVIAVQCVVTIDAAGDRITGIVGTGVRIITVLVASRFATAGRTDVVQGADIVIGTRVIIVRMLATEIQVAGVGCTELAVVTVQWVRSGTRSSRTDVASRTGVSVVAAFTVMHKGTARICQAYVVCARVSIVTVQTAGGLANPIGAGVTYGARVAVGAGQAIIGMGTSADRVAGVCSASIRVVTVYIRGSCTDAIAARL